MKKLVIFLVLIVSAATLFADKTDLAVVTIAGRPGLTAAANKLGELSCNMMLSGMLAGSLAECPDYPVTHSAVVDDEIDVDFTSVTNAAEKLPKGVVAKIRVEGAGLRKVCTKEVVAKDLSDLQKRILKDFESFTAVVKINNTGVSIEGEVKIAPDSELLAESKAVEAVSPEALAFAGKDCVCASAFAANTGADLSRVRSVFDVLKKHGIDVTSFIAFSGEKDDLFMTIDLEALVKAFPQLGQVCATLDKDALKAELDALTPKTFETPAGRSSFAVKGYESPFTPAERFAATLPDLNEKTLARVDVWSYYAIAKATLPVLSKNLPESEGAMVRQIMTILPAEQKGGCALAWWEVNPHTAGFICRISADEIRSFGLASGSVMTVMMAAQMGVGTSDDEDDED